MDFKLITKFRGVSLVKYLVGLIMLSAVNSWAAKPVRPPIEVLIDPFNRIVVAEGVTEPQNEKVTFKVQHSLFGENNEELTIKLNNPAVQNYRKGQSYILVFSEVMKHPIVRDEKVANPDGPSLKNYMVLKAAMFSADRSLVELFRSHIDSKMKEPGAAIDALLEALNSSNLFNQELAAFELQMRKEYQSYYTPERLDQLALVMQKEMVNDELLTLLMQTMKHFNSRQAWLNDFSRKLIKKHGAQVELASFVPGLLIEAAKNLGHSGQLEDTQLLEPLIFSNSPSVARIAFNSIVELDANNAKSVAQTAIDKGKLLKDTQALLERYIRK